MKTDWKEDILAPSMQGKRRYNIYENEDASISLIDSSEYDQVGDVFGATELNQIGEEINNTVGMLTSAVQTAQASAESAQASADRAMQGTPEGYAQLVQDVADTKKSVSDGKSLVASAITDKGVETASDATFATMANNISEIETGSSDFDFIAEPYDSTKEYKKGDIVEYDGQMYICVAEEGRTTTGNFQDAIADWERTYISKVAGENSNLGATLLWTNPNPTSGFDAQTVMLDLSEYESVIVAFTQHTSTTTSDCVCYVSKNNQSPSQGCGIGGGGGSKARQFVIDTSGIRFGNGTLNGSVDNSRMIPLRIYGIRGELF